MRAAVHIRYGPPGVVRICEVEKPTPRDDEVLVRVHATTVNRTDCGFRAAKPFIVRFFTGLRRPRRTVGGTEFAGVVEGRGRGVTAFEVGDRVFGYDEETLGAHAEYLTIAQDASLTTMPAHLTFEEAAPSTEGAHYALMLIRATGVEAGHDVLVYGATGAIGSAAVQLLKHLADNVTAVCDTPNLELVRGLGADRVIDYTAEDFTRDQQSYDVVIDAVGKSTFGRCRRLLKPGGIYVSTDLGRPARGHRPALAGGIRADWPLLQPSASPGTDQWGRGDLGRDGRGAPARRVPQPRRPGAAHASGHRAAP